MDSFAFLFVFIIPYLPPNYKLSFCIRKTLLKTDNFHMLTSVKLTIGLLLPLFYNEDMKKKSMQSIADELSVSRVTVWKALSGRPGVNAKLRERILKKAEESGYWRTQAPPQDSAGRNAAGSAAEASRGTIAVVAARPESSLFWMNIVHEIAAEASLLGANLMYVNVPSSFLPGYSLPTLLSDGTVSGIIIVNVYDEAMLRLINTLPIPKVFLDSVPSVPIPELTGDLVLIEGRIPVRLITRSLIEKGFTRLGFIGDIAYARTNYDRYMGFLDALREAGIDPDPELSVTGRITVSKEYEEISAFLDGLGGPEGQLRADGFVCASDFLAQFVRRYCDSHGIAAGQELMLTGFDNTSEYSNVAGRITTVDVSGSCIGARLAAKLSFRIAHPDSACELSYISDEVIFR